jgi:hypothetical protein
LRSGFLELLHLGVAGHLGKRTVDQAAHIAGALCPRDDLEGAQGVVVGLGYGVKRCVEASCAATWSGGLWSGSR